MIISKELFFDIQNRMDFIPYEQAKGWHDYTIEKYKCQVLYFVDDIVGPKICAWGLITVKLKLFRYVSIVGESRINTLTYKDYQKFYACLIEDLKNKYGLIFVTSNTVYEVDFELGIRLAGFLRPLNFFDSPLSIIIDFSNERPRKRIWKRQVREAGENQLLFKEIKNISFEDIMIFTDMYRELSRRKNLSGYLSREGLEKLFQDKRFKLFFVYKDNSVLAGRIVYVDRSESYDVYAANSDASRNIKGTTYFMMESIFTWLKQNGVKRFDFGRIPVGLRPANSVFEFKSHSGGEVVNYNGSWVYSRNKILEFVLAFYREFKGMRY
mgnify:CR=1 FL=1